MGVTAELSAFTAAIQLDHLPPQVVDRARLLVLDLVGNIVRARHDAESTAPMLAAARAMLPTRSSTSRRARSTTSRGR